ncbi:unnamed protein product [Closterium sp. NIES-54]
MQRLRGMHSRYLVSSLPRSLPPLPPSPAPPCLPCVEGRQRAAPHSSEFPPTEAPLQTLHMDVWGPARVRGQGGEHYFLLVVDDYTRYTTVFPLRTKGEVPDVLIPWIRATRLQLERRFHTDLPVLRLHSDRGGEFSSGLLRAFCQGEGIEQTFTLPASPQQNGVAERRIGLVMEVARTSLIHAAAPHFLWPFAVRYAAHQLNLWPRVSVPETSPTLRWTGEVGDASVIRVWGSRAFVRNTSADKLSSRAVPCVFLGFVPDAPGWQFYHPTSRRVFPSQDVTFDKSVPFYHLFPYRTAPLPPPPLFFTPVEPVKVAVDSGPVRGTEPGGAETGGAETGGAEPRDAEPRGAETRGAEPGGAEPGGAVPRGAEPGGHEPEGTAPGGALLSQQLHEWYSQHCRRLEVLLSVVLQRFNSTYSSPQATPLSTSHSLSALPSDESVEPSGPYPELVGCLMYLMTCTRPDLAYPLSILARYVAPGRHRPEHMAAAKRVLRYLCSTSGMGLVVGGRARVVLTGHADASWVDDLATQRSSQELRWLSYLLTDLGEQPFSPPVLYVDNKAMIALCQEHSVTMREREWIDYE